MTYREFEIGRVISRQSVLSAKILRRVKHCHSSGRIDFSGQLLKVLNERLNQFAGQPVSLFTIKSALSTSCRQNAGTATLLPKAIPLRNLFCLTRLFVGETQGQNDRCVQNKQAHGLLSVSNSLIVRPPRDSPCRLPKVPRRRAASATDESGVLLPSS